nr:hypothetical protein [Paenibacillus sp. JCM 10914]
MFVRVGTACTAGVAAALVAGAAAFPPQPANTAKAVTIASMKLAFFFIIF